MIDVGKEVPLPRGAVKLTKSTLAYLMDRFGVQKDVSVYFCDERTIKDLNSHYRGKDYTTDVLSFVGEGDFLGEIVICVPVAMAQAEESNVTWEAELAMLLTHSFLHLLGYDDETEEGYKQMVALQNSILKDMGYEESTIDRLVPSSH
ncbi:rRNA maturation RNase YbeY [Coprothermobacteraceae bacterium]|nr:rRNA maturation RNase YbeY [Coprothermobacteraceae bacterium]